jgi:YesN/AraC family two-component response regulator
MKNNQTIPVYDLSACLPGTNFIIKKTEGTSVPSYLTTPHRNRDYKISFLLEGEVTHHTDFEKYQIKAPALLMLAPDQVHQATGNSYNKMIHISFNKEFLLTEIQGVVACWECMFGQILIPVANQQQVQELSVYTDLMYQEFTSDRPQKEVMLKNLLNAFIICAARLITCESNGHSVAQLDSSENKIVRQFKALTDEHFVNNTQVSQYADMLYITPGHLNDLIKSVTGKTAKQVIDEKRVMEAKRLLFWGQHSVKQIAGRLNFEDDAYFNRFFKKHTGQTPALFQKNTREKYN